MSETSEITTPERGHKLRNGGHSGRGGRRPGAGRKPDYLKRLGIKALTAAEILAHFNEIELWQGLLNHKSADIRLRTLSYLIDRRDGKAKQALEVSGGLVHAHTAYRDPRLAALSQEEIQALDAITKKLALPSADAAQDAPLNQTESEPAIEAADTIESPCVKHNRPVTSCTHCRAPGYDIELANSPCGRMAGDKRCRGTNQSAIEKNDWDECPSCHGTGLEGSRSCNQCFGSGWLFVQ